MHSQRFSINVDETIINVWCDCVNTSDKIFLYFFKIKWDQEFGPIFVLSFTVWCAWRRLFHCNGRRFIRLRRNCRFGQIYFWRNRLCRLCLWIKRFCLWSLNNHNFLFFYKPQTNSSGIFSNANITNANIKLTQAATAIIFNMWFIFWLNMCLLYQCIV